MRCVGHRQVPFRVPVSSLFPSRCLPVFRPGVWVPPGARRLDLHMVNVYLDRTGLGGGIVPKRSRYSQNCQSVDRRSPRPRGPASSSTGAAGAMFLAYYNSCWRTRLPGKSGRSRPPAAMAAGTADRGGPGAQRGDDPGGQQVRRLKPIVRKVGLRSPGRCRSWGETGRWPGLWPQLSRLRPSGGGWLGFAQL